MADLCILGDYICVAVQLTSLVRMESANGNVHYYEGEKGAERCVCVVQA